MEPPTRDLPGTLILPPRTLTGKGAADGLLAECSPYGASGVIVHGRSARESGLLRRILEGGPDGLAVTCFEHPGGEPALAQLGDVIAAARAAGADWLAGVGGGSVVDVAKAAAGLLHAPLDPVAYHDGESIPPSVTPFFAVPTTAGTGSESTIVSVLTNGETGVKKSIRHPSFMARLAVLDANVLVGCPAGVLAASGMDAFTQAVESHVSNKSTWFSDVMSLRAAALVARSLEAVCADPTIPEAGDLMAGSYLAGVALSNARLGIVHGLAHPLGARFHLPHGLVCAVCLPSAVEFNRDAMGPKYDRLGNEIGNDLLSETRRLLEVLDIRSPFAGRALEDRDAVVEETLASGSTAANPRPVTAADVEALLDGLFGAE